MVSGEIFLEDLDCKSVFFADVDTLRQAPRKELRISNVKMLLKLTTIAQRGRGDIIQKTILVVKGKYNISGTIKHLEYSNFGTLCVSKFNIIQSGLLEHQPFSGITIQGL
jgi:hypothetical protein